MKRKRRSDLAFATVTAGASALAALALVLAAPRAQGSGAPTAPAAELSALRADWRTGTHPERAEFAARVRALVDEAPADPAAVDAVLWFVEEQLGEPTAQDALLGVLLDHQSGSAALAKVCAALRFPTPKLQALLDPLRVKSPHAEVRGRACYAMATALRTEAEYAARLRDRAVAFDGDENQVATRVGAARMEELRKTDPADLAGRAQALLEEVIAKYGDLKDYPTKLGPRAQGDLFELQHLSVGMTAPEIEGEDVDGVPFKLSEYRGKVVLLDFWGFW